MLAKLFGKSNENNNNQSSNILFLLSKRFLCVTTNTLIIKNGHFIVCDTTVADCQRLVLIELQNYSCCRRNEPSPDMRSPQQCYLPGAGNEAWDEEGHCRHCSCPLTPTAHLGLGRCAAEQGTTSCSGVRTLALQAAVQGLLQALGTMGQLILPDKITNKEGNTLDFCSFLVVI